MLSKTAWFKLLIVTIQNLRVSVRFRAQVRFKASKGTLITMMRERVVVVSRRILLNETYCTFHKVLRSLHVVYNCFHNCFCNCFWDERFIFLI